MSLVVITHHLVAAADAEEYLSVFDSRADAVPFARTEVLQEYFLFKILTSSYKEEIVGSQVICITDTHARDLRLHAAPFQTAFQTADISPVSI